MEVEKPNLSPPDLPSWTLQLTSHISWIGDGDSVGAQSAWGGDAGGMGGPHPNGFWCLVLAAEGSPLHWFAL